MDAATKMSAASRATPSTTFSQPPRMRNNGLPMLLGLALTLAAVASLAAVAGRWAMAAIDREGPQTAADAQDLGSAETYVGYAQASGFAAPDGIRQDAPSLYRIVPALQLNRWGLSGIWTIGGEFATLNETPGRVSYRFHARDLTLVLAPSGPGQPIRFRVSIEPDEIRFVYTLLEVVGALLGRAIAEEPTSGAANGFARAGCGLA